MKNRFSRWLILWAGLTSSVVMSAADDVLVLQFPQLALSDGRKLKNVVVKSYDAKSEKLLVIADGKAMTLPVALLPAPLNETLKHEPGGGGTGAQRGTTPR